jgi:peptide/nickel transport system ATP-binding protein
MMEPLIEVSGLKTHFFLDDGIVKAVNGVDFAISRGESLGVVGESGCGKSVTAYSMMRLVPEPPGKIVGGKIVYHTADGSVDIAQLANNSRAMRDLRGNEIAMIFQEPMNSLSPVHTIGNQIGESIRLHRPMGKKEARDLAVEMLQHVKIPRPGQVVDDYPHQLSGGMRQRAMIALALCCNPSLLIADEPTTALDVTVQAQILRLIRDLQQESNMGLMLITHNLGVVAQTVDKVAVVYLGRVVEYGPVVSVFQHPLHPYTRALFSSIPKPEGTTSLHPIRGSVPDPYERIRGCPFRDRCEESIESCESVRVPALREDKSGHSVRCYLYSDDSEDLREGTDE